jgi:hypothetical protein
VLNFSTLWIAIYTRTRLTSSFAEISAPNIIRWIKSRRTGWAGHVGCKEDRRGAYRALIGKPEEKRSLERLRLDGRIIRKSIFNKWDAVYGLD